MADHGCAISLSQISQSSDEATSEHSQRSFAALAGGGGPAIGGASGSSSLHRHRKASASAGYSLLGREPIAEQQILSPPKKPRGRPPGSKNKPKPPLVITQDNEQALRPVVLEISAGSDVVEALVHFARRRHVCISVLSGSGSVSNVALRHPLTHASGYTLRGPFTLLSLSGTYISTPSASSAVSSSSSSSHPPAAISWPPYSSFGISLAGSQGQVFGGVVGGQVIAAGLVVVVATVFKKPEFHRLVVNGSGEGEVEDPAAGCGGGHAGDHQVGGGNDGSNAMAMSAFNVVGAGPAPLNCQLPGDVNVMQWGHPTRPANY